VGVVFLPVLVTTDPDMGETISQNQSSQSWPGGHQEMSSILADQERPRNEPKCGGGGGCGVLANEYSCAHGAQINFGFNIIFNLWLELTLLLTYPAGGVGGGGGGIFPFPFGNCECYLSVHMLVEGEGGGGNCFCQLFSLRVIIPLST
jgi:hypothetical protein